MYNFNHFYYFFITASFGSVSKASLYLKTSQPSLSIQLKTLENNLNMSLFLRDKKKLLLTENGKQLFFYCEKMFQDLGDIDFFIKHKERKLIEKINIGVSEQIERPFIADILGDLFSRKKDQSFPKLKMETLPSYEMLDLLKSGRMDLVISHEKVISPALNITVLEIPVALVGNKKALLKNSTGLTLLMSLLKSTKSGLIVPIEEFKLRNETEHFLMSNNLPFNIVLESSNLSANIRAIREGVGIGFMPMAYAYREISSSKLFYIMPKGGIWKHSIYIYTSKYSIEKKTVKDLLETLEKSVIKFK